ncbi:MAG: hypothetical protein WDW36_008207 [Sanguina aurantia]
MVDATVIDRVRGALWGLLIADSLSMPVHWYYDVGTLQRDFGTITDFQAPRAKHPSSIMSVSNTGGHGRGGQGGRIVGDVINHGKHDFWGKSNVHYHQGMKKGENTLNALCARVVMRSMTATGSYDSRRALSDYVTFMTTPGSHNDTYAESFHRDFFKNFADGVPAERCAQGTEGHNTAQIGGFVMLPPVIMGTLGQGVEAVKAASLKHLALTHDSTKLAAYATSYSELLSDVATSKHTLREAIQAIGKGMRVDFESLAKGPLDDVRVVHSTFGSACYIQDSFPSMLFLAYRYADSFEKAVLANTNVGGENCHRGAALGALMGAALGESNIPQRLIDGLHDTVNIRKEIDAYTAAMFPGEVQQHQKQQANSYVKLRRPQDTAPSLTSKVNPAAAFKQSVSSSKAKPKTLTSSQPPRRPVATPAAAPQAQPTPQQATARSTPPAAAPPSLTSAAPTGRASLLQTPPPRPIINLQGPVRPLSPLPPTPPATASHTQSTQLSAATSSTTQVTSHPPADPASSNSTGPSSAQQLVSANSSLKAAFERDRRSLFDTARKQEFYPASHIGFTTPSHLPPCKEWDARERASAEQRAQQLRQHQQWQLRQAQPAPSPSSAHPGPHRSSPPPHGQQSPPSSNGCSLPTHAAGPSAPSTVTPVSTVTHPSADTSQPPSHGPSLQASSGHPSTSDGHAAGGGAVRHVQQTRRPWSSPLSHPREQEEVSARRRVASSTSSVDDDVSGGSSSSGSDGSGKAASTALPAAGVPAGKGSSGQAGAGKGAVVQTTGVGSSSSSSSGGETVAERGGSMDEPSSGLGRNSPATVTLKSSRSRRKAAAAALEAEQTGSSSPAAAAAAAASVPHASSSASASSSGDASTSHAGSLVSSSSSRSSMDGSSPPDSDDASIAKGSSGSGNSSSKVAVPTAPAVVHRTRIHQPAEWNHSQPRPPPPSEEEWRRVLVGEYQSRETDHYGEDAGFVRKMLSSRGRVLVIGKSSTRGLWNAIRVVRMARSMLLQTESHVPVFQPVVLQTEGDRSVQGLPPGCLILYTQKILAGSYLSTGPPMWVSQDSDPAAVARAVHTRMARAQQPAVLECFGPAAGSVAVHAMAAARLLAQGKGRDLCVMVDEGEEVEVADNAYGTALLTRFIIMACAPSQPTYLRNKPSLKFLARRS